MLSSHSIHISLSNEKNAGRDSSTSGVTDLAIQKRVSEMQRPPLDRPGPRIGDMIKRFRTATPTSRETRQETRQPEASRFWWETGPARQAEPLPEYAAPQQDWRQSDSFTHVMDGLDMELDRAGLVSALNRSHRRYGGVHTDSLLSLPDVLALHQSLEVDVIAPPPAKEEEKPAEPDTKESVATILESLDVTMARLNWRLKSLRRSAPAALHEKSEEQPASPPKPAEPSLIDSFCISDDEPDDVGTAAKPPWTTVSSGAATVAPAAAVKASPAVLSSVGMSASPAGSGPAASSSIPSLLQSVTTSTAVILSSPVVLPTPIASSAAALTSSTVGTTSISASVLMPAPPSHPPATTSISASVSMPAPPSHPPATTTASKYPVDLPPPPAHTTPASSSSLLKPLDDEWKELQKRQEAAQAKLSAFQLPPIPPPDTPIPFPHGGPFHPQDSPLFPRPAPAPVQPQSFVPQPQPAVYSPPQQPPFLSPPPSLYTPTIPPVPSQLPPTTTYFPLTVPPSSSPAPNVPSTTPVFPPVWFSPPPPAAALPFVSSLDLSNWPTPTVDVKPQAPVYSDEYSRRVTALSQLSLAPRHPSAPAPTVAVSTAGASGVLEQLRTFQAARQELAQRALRT